MYAIRSYYAISAPCASGFCSKLSCQVSLLMSSSRTSITEPTGKRVSFLFPLLPVAGVSELTTLSGAAHALSLIEMTPVCSPILQRIRITSYNVCYTKLLRPASQVASYVNLIPVFGVILSMLILGEKLNQAQWLACGLVFCGVWISNRSEKQLVQPIT